jgi:nucleotide-binding universal stress UspA family protein
MNARRASAAWTGGRHAPPEVVAGLEDDDSTETVARAAVGLARRLGVGVRFIHVSQPGIHPDDRARAESTTFEAAIGAVQGRNSVPMTFESVTGTPGEVLVTRSEACLALVLGERVARPDGMLGPTAAYCAQHARCPVHVVGPGPARQDLGPLDSDEVRRRLDEQARNHRQR